MMPSLAYVALAALAQPAGHVAVPQLFSDHMMLQRDANAPVWGTADAGGIVTVSIAGQAATATAGADGTWRAVLTHLPAGGPYTMTIRGQNTLTINDVLVGDVYVAAGQSNIAYPLLGDPTNAAAAAQAHDPNLREFAAFADLQPKPQPDFHANSQWIGTDDPNATRNWSAVAYYFARQLRSERGVPIGIIASAVGETLGEAWMSAAAVEKHANLLAMTQWKIAWLLQHGIPAANATPGYAFNAMVNPMLGYGVKGVLWYQGEGDGWPRGGEQYQTLLPALIADWRAQWAAQLPFYIVQLPAFSIPGFSKPAEDPNAYSEAAFVREGQLQAAQSVPQTGLAIALDLGDAAGDVHPPDKRDLGLRLAALVQHGRTGPLYAGYDITGNRVAVRFTHADGGLVARNGPLRRFAIAGRDRKFVWASARISGNGVVVSSPRIRTPVAVRYAWADNPRGANLYNAAGFPASPFRTDTW